MLKNSTQRKTFLTLFFLGIFYFFLFWHLNAQGARDLNMLSAFSPDEFVQYPHLIKMLNQPADSFLRSIYRFVQYEHYYYGYPFYLYSALFAALPLRLLRAASISLDLLFLRQIVGVLPMLVGVGFLVYMQTQFKSLFRSAFLFLLLMTVPMTVINNLWWHPESLVFLFVVLTLFFLQRDNLSFRRDFYISAIFCGLAVATKLIGLFFFAVISIYIFIGWIQKKISLNQALGLASKFVLLMSVAFFTSSPFLLFKSERDAAIKAQREQSEATVSGFVFSSEKGPALWMPVIEKYYAQPSFLALMLVAAIAGVFNRERRLNNLLIILWTLSFGTYLLFFVALRHRYYPMPIFLPLFSMLPAAFDWIGKSVKSKPLRWAGAALAVLILGNQILYNLSYDKRIYMDAFYKEASSPALTFYSRINKEYLSRIVLDRQLLIYRSVRVYIADDPRWAVKSRWSLADYSYIEKTQPDLIILWKQEVLDYTNEDEIENATHPEIFQEALPFYQDARNGELRGYVLLYQDNFGLMFVNQALSKIFFE